MKKARYERKGKMIRDLKSDEVEVYPSNNQAKRASREIQLKMDGGLGRGSVRLPR